MALTAIVAVGVGVSAVGTVTQMEASKKSAEASQKVAQAQQEQLQQQKQLQDLQTERARIQNIRQMTIARSIAAANAAGNGAQYGSGLVGGYGQIQGQYNYNMLGIDQNAQISQNTYGIASNINSLKAQQAGYQSDYYMGQGLSSLGGSLVQAAGTIDRLGQTNFFGDKSSNSVIQYRPNIDNEAFVTGRGLY